MICHLMSISYWYSYGLAVTEYHRHVSIYNKMLTCQLIDCLWHEKYTNNATMVMVYSQVNEFKIL